MEKYYKVGESTLLDLLEKACRFEILVDSGVDNWYGYEEAYYDFLETYCVDHGISSEQFYEGALDFSDIAKSDLSKFEEI